MARQRPVRARRHRRAGAHATTRPRASSRRWSRPAFPRRRRQAEPVRDRRSAATCCWLLEALLHAGRRRPPARGAGDAAARPGRRRASPRFDERRARPPRMAGSRPARWRAALRSAAVRWRWWSTCAPRMRRACSAWCDGERRLTNYLQLAEALQDAERRARPAGGWSTAARAHRRRRCRRRGELLRLESDARRVQIVTLHKSKGLEYPLVFLPYVGNRRGAHASASPAMAHVPRRRAASHCCFRRQDDAAAWQRSEIAKLEQRAEEARLLYVGLTRARLATWVVWGAVNDAHETALAWLLHRCARIGKVERHCAGRARATALAAAVAARRSISVQPAPLGDRPAAAALRPGRAGAGRQRSPRACSIATGGCYSFSQSGARGQRRRRRARADDEIEAWPELA